MATLIFTAVLTVVVLVVLMLLAALVLLVVLVLLPLGSRFRAWRRCPFCPLFAPMLPLLPLCCPFRLSAAPLADSMSHDPFCPRARSDLAVPVPPVHWSRSAC